MSNEMPIVENDSDRRISERKPVELKGSLAGEIGSVDCVVQNLSTTGAKVQVVERFECKSTVTLTIHRFGALHGNMIWRYNDKVGISFLEECPELAAFVEEEEAAAEEES